MDKSICLIVLPAFFSHLLGSFTGLQVSMNSRTPQQWLLFKSPQVWLTVQRLPIVFKPNIETNPPCDGGSKNGLIAGIVVAGSCSTSYWEVCSCFPWPRQCFLCIYIYLFHPQLCCILTCCTGHLWPRWSSADSLLQLCWMFVRLFKLTP